MKKHICQFHFETYALLLDFDNAPAAVAVNAKSGDILLNEGVGKNCFDGAVIFPADFRTFRIVDTGAKSELQLGYGDNHWHSLGTSSDTHAMNQWVSQAEKIIRANQPETPQAARFEAH